MPQYVLRRAYQLFLGEPADLDEISIGVFDIAIEIGRRDDCLGFVERKFGLADGQIEAHGAISSAASRIGRATMMVKNWRYIMVSTFNVC